MTKDRFTLTEGVVYGVPQTKPKDVAAWQQGQKLIKAQAELRASAKEQSLEIARMVQAGQLTQEQGRAEMVRHLTSAIHGFVDQQGKIAEGIVRQTDVLQDGLQHVIRGQQTVADTIQDETRHQTSVLIASQHFQTGNLLGGEAPRPAQLKELGVGDQAILKLIANGAIGIGTPSRSEVERRLDPLQMKVLDGIITDDEEKALKRLEESGQDMDYRELTRIRRHYSGKSTLELVRSGEISSQVAETLIRHQKLSARDTEALLEAGVVRGPLGSARRMNIAMDYQTAALETMLDQNDRRDFLLASVSAGINGMMGESLEQTRLQSALVQQSRRQTKLAEAQVLTGERTNELIENMAQDLVGRIDLTNTSLDVINTQLDQLIGNVTEGLQNACLVFAEGAHAMGKEIALTRFVIGSNLEHLSKVTLTGFAVIDERLAETNTLLNGIVGRLDTPEATSIKESAQIAVRLIQAGNLSGALSRLQKTTPGEHDFEVVHFLIGYISFKLGDAVAAAHSLGWAKKHAVIKHRADVAEYAGTLLAQIALELGEFSLSAEALESLVTDRIIAPHLRNAHIEFAALQSFAGHMERAIDSTIDQIVTNPDSIDQVLNCQFIDSITQGPYQEKWDQELSELIQRQTPQDSYFHYMALSIFAGVKLKNPSLTLELIRAALRIRKKQLRPLRRADIDKEIRSISPANAVQLVNPLSILSQEQEFTWLKK